jgi:hypothetical protein
VVVLIALALLGTSWAYVVGTRPGNENFVAKSADWFRDHHLSGVADWVEREWYSHQAPPIGGDPSRSIAASVVATEAGGGAAKGGPTLPPTVSSPASPALPNEGVWQTLVSAGDGQPAIAEAQIRPDSIHTGVLGALVWMDPTRLDLMEVPGTVEPGGNWPIIGTVPPEMRARLVGAFNGGFRFKDAAGGYFSAGHAGPPLVDNVASFVIRNDGTVDVGQWGRDDRMGPDIASVRQNLPLIIDGGRPVPGLDDNTNHRWGYTLGSRVYVWRSAIGIRADGALVYAASDGLTATSLADMLVRAGVVRGMELDINPEWVTGAYYQHTAAGQIDPHKLIDGETKPANHYFEPSTRDFYSWSLRP